MAGGGPDEGGAAEGERLDEVSELYALPSQDPSVGRRVAPTLLCFTLRLARASDARDDASARLLPQLRELARTRLLKQARLRGVVRESARGAMMLVTLAPEQLDLSYHVVRATAPAVSEHPDEEPSPAADAAQPGVGREAASAAWTPDDVHAYLNRLCARGLDPHRPLWQLHVVAAASAERAAAGADEGGAPGEAAGEGGALVLFVIDRALTDAAGALGAVLALCEPLDGGDGGDGSGGGGDGAGDGGPDVLPPRSMLPPPRRPPPRLTNPLARARALASGVADGLLLEALPSDSRSVLRLPSSAPPARARALAACEPIPLAALHAVRARAALGDVGAPPPTVNDVLWAALTLALRRLLDASAAEGGARAARRLRRWRVRGVLLESRRAAGAPLALGSFGHSVRFRLPLERVPTRPAGVRAPLAAGAMGLGQVRSDCAAGGAGMRARARGRRAPPSPDASALLVRAVRSRIEAARAGPGGRLQAGLLAALAPPMVAAGRRTELWAHVLHATRKTSIVLANLAGPAQPVSLGPGRSPVVELSLAVLSPAPLYLAAVSYAGTLRLSVSADARLGVDAAALARAFGDGCEGLLLASAPGGQPTDWLGGGAGAGGAEQGSSGVAACAPPVDGVDAEGTRAGQGGVEGRWPQPQPRALPARLFRRPAPALRAPSRGGAAAPGKTPPPTRGAGSDHGEAVRV